MDEAGDGMARAVGFLPQAVLLLVLCAADDAGAGAGSGGAAAAFCRSACVESRIH